DLIGPEYSYNAAEEILLEKKEHMKARGLASPDYGDALALTFAEDVAPRETPEYLNPSNYGRDKPYDRYAELQGNETYDRYNEIR
ncbi:MAG: terminase, partial [Gemmatimonadota bacterium]|nr:terminase [Gemmatimonadota bacterium]